MSRLHIRHITHYEYRHPVALGEHRLMTRPRDSHDLRLLDTSMVIDPPASTVRWIHDVFGNSIAIVNFEASTQKLTFTSDFRAEHYPADPRGIEIEAYASSFPFSYSASDIEARRRPQSDPVAVARDPSQAAPLCGTFKGNRDAFLSMSVKVEITTE